MADFTFMHPLWFAALIPLIIVLPWLKGKAQHSGLIAPHLAEKLGLTQQQPKRWPIGLLALGWLIAVVAMAGPSWQKVKLPAYNLSGARVLVMNMSQSMYATDIKPNRLTQERFKALDMLPSWKEGSTGLVAFAGDGYEVSPLTTDSSTLRNLIPSLSPEVMPIAGNNAAKGIAEAIRLLKQAGHNTGDIILMTDGMTKTVAQQALAELKGTHYRVSILAMGTVEGAPIQLPSGNLLLENGAPVMSKIDIGTLMSITDSTGGVLQMAQATDNGVNAIVNFTAKPLASGKKGHEKELQERLNGGFWLILPLLLLALLGFRRGIVLAAMFVLLPIDHAQASPWTNTNRQAYEIFTDGNYKQAAQDFTSPQWKGIAEYKAKQYDQAIETLKPLQDPTSQYNLGNAYAQKGDYKQAAATYEKVLQQQPDFADAKKNLAIVEQAEKQRQQQEEQKKQANKDQQQQQGQQGNKDQQQQTNQQQQQLGNENKQQSMTEAEKKQQAEHNAQQALSQPGKEVKQGENQPSAVTMQQGKPSADQQQVLSVSNPILKKLEQVPDDTAGLIRAQLMLQAQQRAEQQQSNKSW
ncbi:hypothetical protein C0W35_13370 [Photobacterium kishitanii]|uniref:vWA domain-containing protein n=1 Tax=Photobacterium kishitanii TaxID=318456 RepID=UPI000D16651A|nr:VWA domain-containing protein [Photobacterium kishitanii]PSU93010.1 hypothetical protein C0W35_13370 [Photobacterium kishitanii]